MTRGKNYNSIVFLTTLSVYLGLVLVGGATPQVLAQAALTRDFDIKIEAEVKDDLDKKPDEDLFASTVSSLINELDEFSRKGLFDWKSKTEYQIEDLRICESDESPAFMGSGSISRQVDKALDNAGVKIARRLFGKKSDLGLGDLYSHTIDYKFVLDNGALSIEATVKNINSGDNGKDIQPLVNELNGYLNRILSTSQQSRTKEKIIAENTKVTSENNQIFVVTRLPRGSIDSLLAKDAN